MSPAINELTPPAEAPPTTITSGSMSCFLNSPLSSAIQIAALIGVNELKPIRRRSAAIALVKRQHNRISPAVLIPARNFSGQWVMIVNSWGRDQVVSSHVDPADLAFLR